MLSPQISAQQRLVQLLETAAVQQSGALSVSCRWDLWNVTTPTLRETALGTSVGSATTGTKPEYDLIDI
mgnify:FL=1